MAMQTVRAAAVMLLSLGGALGAAQAAEVKTEVSHNGDSQVRVFVRDFLSAEELATLRVVASNKQALELFVKSNKGFAAMAASPVEGVVRNGKPVASAVAIADLPDQAAAHSAALKACNAAKKATGDCVIVLDVAPKP